MQVNQHKIIQHNKQVRTGKTQHWNKKAWHNIKKCNKNKYNTIKQNKNKLHLKSKNKT